MKVFAGYADPKELVSRFDDRIVLLTGFDDPMVLDLVAHFLCIATHHNDNAAPSEIAALYSNLCAADV
jgi:hypothetical protein